MNATTGTLLWKYPTHGVITSSPMVADGVVYFASSIDDYNVYALNAATGAFLWNYTTMSGIISSPTVADGIVYIGSNSDENLYAFHLPGHKDSN